VHNVNGKGEDAGVVYSEMQGRENGADDLMQLRFVPHIYSTAQQY
jgi:Zn-dependent M16 (insulinase) family peptidase